MDGTEEGCVFCRIIRGDEPCYLVREDETSVAFLDLRPITRGHTLVVPRTHVEGLVDLSPEQRARYIESIVEVCRIVGVLSPHYNIGCNRGSLAGQVVFHLHFHIIPRYDGDRTVFRRRMRIDPHDAERVLREMGVAPART